MCQSWGVSSAGSGGGSDGGPGHVAFCCDGVSQRWNSVPETLRHRLYWRAPGHRLERCCLHACYRSPVLFAHQRNAGATLSGESKRSAVQEFYNQKQKPAENPPQTPRSQAESEQTETGQMQARTHSPHTNAASHPPTNPQLPSPSPSQEILHSHKKENHSKYVLETTSTLSFSPSSSLFPLLLCSSLASLFMFSISSASPSMSSLRELLRFFFLVHGNVSSD